MADSFSEMITGLKSPARSSSAITPHDTNDLAQVTRAIYVGGAGAIKVLLADDTTAVTFAGASAGTVLNLRVKRVYSTDTTATNLVGLY